MFSPFAASLTLSSPLSPLSLNVFPLFPYFYTTSLALERGNLRRIKTRNFSSHKGAGFPVFFPHPPWFFSPFFSCLHDRHLIFTIPPRLFIFHPRGRHVAASRQLIWDHGWICYSNGSGKKVSRKAPFLPRFPIVTVVVVIVDLIKDVTELKTFIEKLTAASLGDAH